ncbi:MAG: four helix bundle protein [Bacteroidota bacterium]
MDLSKFHLIEQANQVSGVIWEEVKKWNYFEKNTVGGQLTRAADSIAANLSEAHGRYSFPDRKRFAFYARGSLCETTNWIEISIQRKLIEEKQGKEMIMELQNLSIQINRYIRYLNKMS